MVQFKLSWDVCGRVDWICYKMILKMMALGDDETRLEKLSFFFWWWCNDDLGNLGRLGFSCFLHGDGSKSFC